MAINAIVPWYGSNRTLAPEVGKLLAGKDWVGVPFAGGMSELKHIRSNTILVNDLHCDVVNLAVCLADRVMGPRLIRELRRAILHPKVLELSQEFCRRQGAIDPRHLGLPVRAYHYFVCAWMGRNGEAGTDREFEAALSVRLAPGGGDSATRYRSAVKSMAEWRRIVRNCSFRCMDWMDFLTECPDRGDCAIYLDPPFAGPGKRYKVKFPDERHAYMARRLVEYKKARIVCRYYDTPLVRLLYPESGWQWHHFVGRKQSNKPGSEVLLVRN